MQEITRLRMDFCAAAQRGDLEGMKPYLDTRFAADEERRGTLIMAFTMAVKAKQEEAVHLMLGYTKEAGMGPPMLYALALSSGGDEGLKLYQSAARKRQP